MAKYELKIIKDSLEKLYKVYSAEVFDKAEADNIITHVSYYKRKFLKYSKTLHKASSRDREKYENDLKRCKFVAYCLDTLFEILEEGSQEKIRDFLLILLYAPDLVLDEQNLASRIKLTEGIDSFRRSYGNKYFKSYFGKKDISKSRAGYFSSKSDIWFRKTHTIVFPALLALGILSVVAAVIYVIL